MTPQDFATRTRADREQFDSIRATVFEPTAEEIAQQEQEQATRKQQLIEEKLATIGMTIPTTLTKTWVVTFMNNINAKQWVGEDIQKYLQGQLELHGTYKKVLEYLIFTYL